MAEIPSITSERPMPEFLGFISPKREGIMPLQELVLDTQRQVYEVMAGVYENLPESKDPELRRLHFRLDDGREVARIVLRNCATVTDYYTWRRQQTDERITKWAFWLVAGMDGLARFYGHGRANREIPPKDDNETGE